MRGRKRLRKKKAQREAGINFVPWPVVLENYKKAIESSAHAIHLLTKRIENQLRRQKVL
jgi:hypothetical protein